MSKFIAPNATENIALEEALPLVRKLNLIGIVTGGVVAIATTGGDANAEVPELADFEQNSIARDTPAHLFVRLDGPTSNSDGGNEMPVSGGVKSLAASLRPLSPGWKRRMSTKSAGSANSTS